VTSRTRSKFGHTDQNVADRTRSKLQAICNSSSKELFFSLYDAVMLKGQENWKNVDVPFHLGASECLIYPSALMKPKSQSELDWLCQLHVLDKTEDDLDESWECTKVINERKRQQQEEDKYKKSSHTNGNDTFKMSERNKNTSSKLPNQYAKVKNTAKGEEVQDDTDHNYGFVDEFLEEALNTSNIYEAQQDTDYDFWISDHNVHTSISMNNTLYNKCMNLLFLPENHHISILDGGADTCVLGKGWEVLSIHSSRRANVVGFDHDTAIKRNLPIVSAIFAIDLPWTIYFIGNT
jgi:hypothetical protein